MLFHLGNVEQLIQDDSKVAFPQMISTERPDKAANHLLEGRVVILVNGSPYSLLLPGLYIAVLNFHTELVPTPLLFTIAGSRNSVPFPVIFEVLLMEISFELIREAGLRIPNPIGPTIRNYWCINFRRCCCKCKFS